MNKIKILRFALLPVIILVLLLTFSVFKNDNSDVDSARLLLKNINEIRIAIDEYYLESGEFPDLVSYENVDNLKIISFIDKSGKEKTFKDFLKQNKFPETPKYKKLKATNKVSAVEDFNNVTNDGGWNYNIKTGEIHANIPYNYFNQSIDWNSF